MPNGIINMTSVASNSDTSLYRCGGRLVHVDGDVRAPRHPHFKAGPTLRRRPDWTDTNTWKAIECRSRCKLFKTQTGCIWYRYTSDATERHPYVLHSSRVIFGVSALVMSSELLIPGVQKFSVSGILTHILSPTAVSVNLGRVALAVQPERRL
ncbi:hypothetical protein J6590_036051 [Homalodisca vitripennis]|nr:hypothetical protein J6590_036051 [Homalodisca vitripennis]